MSHPTPAGNGCSLEDCHTNLFSLTDLSGIKWRKLRAKSEYAECIDPTDDPVLSTYVKCIQSDILSVWRKVLANESSKPNSPPFTKELWIFWYGDAPSDSLISSELSEADHGSWDCGLSYECRTLLFKALHNLIERCLLTKNFVRIGKWFVQPFEKSTSSSRDRSQHLSISFSFFLHGESTVCASIDVRQHPPLRRLMPRHLQLASSNGSSLPVVLAPYGLAGVLTGQTCQENDPASRRIMEDWKQFYPIDCDCKPGDESQVPPCVEVIVSGMKMRYPSCFVLVSDSDRPPSSGLGTNNGSTPGLSMQPIPLTPPTSPGDAHVSGETSIKVVPNAAYASGFLDLGNTDSGHVLRHKVAERVWQDSCFTSASSRRANMPDTPNSEDLANLVGTWDFADATSRNGCQCSKSKSAKSRVLSGKGGLAGGKHGKNGEKMERQQSRRNVMPFHRRTSEDVPAQDASVVIQGNQGSAGLGGCSGRGAGDPVLTTSVNTPDARFSTGVGTPHSAAPSPLVGSHESNSGGQTVDPTMPTLSPHPPTSSGKDLTHAGGGTQTESRDGTNQSTTEQYPKNPSSVLKIEPLSSPYATFDPVKSESVTNWLDSQSKLATMESRLPKRPLLAASVNESEEYGARESLYDFSTLQNWFDQPVKRFKPDSVKQESSFSQPAAGSAPSPQVAMATFQSSVYQSERPSVYSALKSQQSPAAPAPPPVDPYEFSDESSTNTTGTFSFRRKSRESSSRQDEEKDRIDTNGIGSPFTPSSIQPRESFMTRDKDIVPKVSDLEHLFDSDDDSNDDDPFQQPNSPGYKFNEPRKSSSLNNSSEGAFTGPTPTDLATMYPTPPSLENNTATSPCCPTNEGTTDLMATAAVTDTTAFLHPLHSHHHRVEHGVLRSPTEDKAAKDWTFVFRLPVEAKFVDAKKYAPIELPSSKLAPLKVPAVCSYKPSWQYPMAHTLPIMDKLPQPQHINSHYVNIPSVENLARTPRSDRMIDSSPATFHGSTQQRTPMGVDLQSPASNASSYLNKTLNSVDNQATHCQTPESHSLVVNITLSDSLLNLFKDHNFDSCNICVCNMDIKGGDVGVYLPDPQSEPRYKCTCGFSAVTNRYYGFGAGLFYEDEVEVTGRHHDRFERRKSSPLAIDSQKLPSEPVSMRLMSLLQDQFSNPFSSLLVRQRMQLVGVASTMMAPCLDHPLQVHDAVEVLLAALDQGRQAVDNQTNVKLDDSMVKASCIHKWPYIHNAPRPSNSSEVVRLLRSLQPWLQDAIQRKRTSKLWERTYTIAGPLSWKDFHKMAGRGSDEACEPQPIPSLLVSSDKDWLSLSPHALKFWEKLSLKPYGRPRDVAYMVVAPDNDYVLSHAKSFFAELSTVYELCRMGRHVPLDKSLRDGILRVGKNTYRSLESSDIDGWFGQLGEMPVASKLRLYAKACKHLLAPLLNRTKLDRSLFETTSSASGGGNSTAGAVKSQSVPYKSQQPVPSPAQPHSVESQPQTPQSNSYDDKDTDQHSCSQKESSSHDSDTDSCGEQFTLVIYVVEPFAYNNDWEDLRRLATVGLERCFLEMTSVLQESLRDVISLQIVPIGTMVDPDSDGRRLQLLKSLAFSVYAQNRRLLSPTSAITGRSLTGFGPAAMADLHLKGSHRGLHKIFCPPFVLANSKDKQTQLAESCGSETTDRAAILFCSYCLSEDQRWLIATVTDSIGELLETCSINIEIPNRNRRKNASARKNGLQKMWEFILGVVTTNVMPVRLVIGRLGRLGHGELKGWAGLLSRKSLLLASREIRGMCTQCALLPPSDMPCILSACFVSVEAQSTFHVMPDSVKAEERPASSLASSTPQDTSCTHILVFPTSSTAQANMHSYQSEHTLDISVHMGADMGEDDLFGIKGDLSEMDPDLNDFFASASPLNSPVGSPTHNQVAPGSPGLGGTGGGRQSPSQYSSTQKLLNSATLTDLQEEGGNLLQQPLAMGYYLSTAKPGPLPKWFWYSCPQAENAPTTCFKAALHIHTPAAQQNQDELFHDAQKKTHPLDSSQTCDVLRHVLESFNALSWLTMDPVTNDRRSCLPIHFLVLIQLYHALNAFV